MKIGCSEVPKQTLPYQMIKQLLQCVHVWLRSPIELSWTLNSQRCQFSKIQKVPQNPNLCFLFGTNNLRQGNIVDIFKRWIAIELKTLVAIVVTCCRLAKRVIATQLPSDLLNMSRFVSIWTELWMPNFNHFTLWISVHI